MVSRRAKFGVSSFVIPFSLEHSHSHSHEPGDQKKKSKSHGSNKKSKRSSAETRIAGDSPSSSGSGTVTPSDEEEQRGRSRERSNSLFGYPAATRALVIQEAEQLQRNRSPSLSRSASNNLSASLKHEFTHRSLNSIGSENALSPTVFSPAVDERPSSESTPLLSSQRLHGHSREVSTNDDLTHSHGDDDQTEYIRHSGAGAHSHGHGSMNMRAILLHVLGDALGNVGVIATGLIMWFSTLSWKYYFDPIISLVITCIIFSSALPLGKLCDA